MHFLGTQVAEIIILGNRIRGGAKLPSQREFSSTSIAQKRDTRFCIILLKVLLKKQELFQNDFLLCQ